MATTTVKEWQGFAPGTAAARGAAAAYQAPAGIIMEAPLRAAPFRGAGDVGPGGYLTGAGLGAGAGIIGPGVTPDPSIPAPLVIGAAALAGQQLGLGDWLGNLFQWLWPGGDPSGGYVNGIPLQGPGLPEPPPQMVAKEWSTGTAQFYLLIDGRIAVYSKKKKRWKVYRPQKHIVVPRNPRIGTLIRADIRTDRLMAKIGKRVRRVTRKVTVVKG